VRIPSAESLRFPEEGSSAQGKSGPKGTTKMPFEQWGDTGRQTIRLME